MLYSALLATTAAVLASASPLKTRQSSNNTYSITDWAYGCSPGGCTWRFNASLPATDFAPALSNVACSGTGYDTDYVDCAPINANQTLRAYVNETGPVASEQLVLYLDYTYTDSMPNYVTTWDQYGQGDVESNDHCPTCPTAYDIPVVKTAAIV